MAAQRGIPFRELVSEALAEKLTLGATEERPWMKTFGKLRGLRKESARINLIIRHGIEQSRNRLRYERWLGSVIVDCRILRIDEETAVEYGNIRSELKRKGRPIPGNDVWIAALARQHSTAALSRDEHFDLVSKLKRVAW